MIEATNVSFGYGNPKSKNYKEQLHDISLKINDGDFVALIGSNGAGKSTFSKVLAGLLKPVQGTVLVNGLDTKKTRNSQMAKILGFLFQNPDRQLCCYTVREEIAFGLKATKFGTKKEIDERTEAILNSFSFDGSKAPFGLSRGERQKLALASIIAVNPKIMILDEPTTGLDYDECHYIMDTVKAMNKNGATVIMVCHDMDLVEEYADRVITIADNHIQSDVKKGRK